MPYPRRNYRSSSRRSFRSRPRRQLEWIRGQHEANATASLLTGAVNLAQSILNDAPAVLQQLQAGVPELQVINDDAVLPIGDTVTKIYLNAVITASDPYPSITQGIVKHANPNLLGTTGHAVLPGPFTNANSGDWMHWASFAAPNTNDTTVTTTYSKQWEVNAQRRIGEYGESVFLTYRLGPNTKVQWTWSMLVKKAL